MQYWAVDKNKEHLIRSSTSLLWSYGQSFLKERGRAAAEDRRRFPCCGCCGDPRTFFCPTPRFLFSVLFPPLFWSLSPWPLKAEPPQGAGLPGPSSSPTTAGEDRRGGPSPTGLPRPPVLAHRRRLLAAVRKSGDGPHRPALATPRGRGLAGLTWPPAPARSGAALA